jgi:hypothetical protein
MGPGINYHLTVNLMLREILELGAPLPVYDADNTHRPTKLERVRKTAFSYRNYPTRGMVESIVADPDP